MTFRGWTISAIVMFLIMGVLCVLLHVRHLAAS